MKEQFAKIIEFFSPVELQEQNDLKMFVAGKDTLEQAAEIWQYLQHHVGNVAVTGMWEWVENWLRYYGDTVDFHFIVGMQGDTPVAVALVCLELLRPLPLKIKAYHVGTNGEPYKDQAKMIGNTILVTEKARAAFYTALVETITKKFKVEEIVFNDFSEAEGVIFADILKKKKLRVTVQREPTLFLNLENIRTQGEDVLDEYGHYMRRAIKRSLKIFNDITVEWAENEKQAIDILEELISLYQATWQKLGRPGMFSSERFYNFQKAVIPALLKHQAVGLFRVKSKRFGTIGCLYFFIHNKTAYTYQIGVADFSNLADEELNPKRLKTSYVVHALCMRECMNRGLNEYNFLTGVYPFKQQMTNGEKAVVTVSGRKSIKPLIRDTIMETYAKLDDSSRNSPIFTKIVRVFARG